MAGKKYLKHRTKKFVVDSFKKINKNSTPILFYALALIIIITGSYSLLLNNENVSLYVSQLAGVSAGFSSNLNVGTINIRAIVVNIDELGNMYGSYGMPFTQSKLSEVDQALKGLNKFVKQSSYINAQLNWNISGVYELGSGVCNHSSYQDKVNDLIQRALTIEDKKNPIPDHSYFMIVHPMPDCGDGETWTFEGRGTFTPYTLNGRVVNLRGVHISDLYERYLFHEFGHSLGYKTNQGIGHPSYLKCSITKTNDKVKIDFSGDCSDLPTTEMPLYTVMSPSGNLSDYSAIEKELIGWLIEPNIITIKSGDNVYTLSPLEQNNPGLRAIKITIPNTNYIVYISFRQPAGYIYPTTPSNKPNGVILDVYNTDRLTDSFLVTNNLNKDNPLQIGIPYKLVNGPTITVKSIVNNLATVKISFN